MSEFDALSKIEVEDLYRRISALESAVDDLSGGRTSEVQPPKVDRWWLRELGRFDNDSIYEEILRLGREYRESTIPTDEDEE